MSSEGEQSRGRTCRSHAAPRPLILTWPRVLPCRRHTIDGSPEQWYECTEPSALDPTINCMLAPEWMGLEEGTWLCTDALKSEDKLTIDSYSENSY